MTRAVAIVVGHDERDKGAVAVAPLSCQEYDYNTEIAKLCLDNAPSFGLVVKVFTRNAGLKECYREVNQWLDEMGGVCAMELHFNASDNPSVMGTETLYLNGNPHGEMFAKLVQIEVLKAIAYLDASSYDYRPNWNAKHNRRTKALVCGNRGYLNLTLLDQKYAGVIVEPFFGTNPDDAKAGFDHKEAYAKALLTAARCFYAV